ncbi:MAG: ATP-dependent RNA helicase HrpA [Lysobacterales bacterium]
MESRKAIEGLEKELRYLMQADAAWCATRLAGARARLKRGQPVDRILAKVAERARQSSAQRAQRAQALPGPAYDGQLPIHGHREEIIAAIREHPVLILAGETGSGKTTQLPKMCLEAGRGTRGLIGCTQPRRIAARAMAERVSEELGTALGAAVGYQVRFRERLGSESFVKFMTDGILLAETAHDRHLDAYDTLVIDEAHERSLNIDFILGYLRQLLPRRPDLRVIITSATIDTEKFSRHFDSAPVIEVSGRGYPVEVVYQPVSEEEGQQGPGNRNLYRGIGQAVSRLGRIDPRGDILVFLSGEREIRETMRYLGRQGLRNTEVLPLYARLSAAEQRRVFHPGAARRIILSTNVAETSLTVPRIRFVIDSGFARISRYAHRSRIQRLPIEPVSQASANQRMGRCGRLGPGTCVRLYSEEDFDLRPEFTEPEILRTSLASVILRMGTMELGAVEAFPFIDSPAPRMISDAYQLLFELGAVDADRGPTGLGRQLSGWPLDVRLARVVVEGARQGCLEDLLVVAAGLSIQDPRERPLEAQGAADQAHERFAHEKSDFVTLLKLWSYLRKQRKEHTGNQFRKLCRREFLNWQRVLEWFDLYQQLRDQAREERLPLKGGHGGYDQVHRALLSGLLSQVGQRDPEDPSYHGARGRRFHIFPGSGLFGRSPKWLMAAEIVDTSRPYARVNAQIQAEWIERVGGHLLKRRHFDPWWSRRRGEVMAYEQVSLFGLILVEKRRVRYGPVDPAEARRIFIRDAVVTGDVEQTFEFLSANSALKRQLEAEEHKKRARDVLVDDSALFGFFNQRLPSQVCSVRSLERWLAGADKSAARSLLLTADDLVRPDARAANQDDWPDVLVSAGHTFALSYRFEPGDSADGVSVMVPLDCLNLLDPGDVQWVVPGLLTEKVIALLKTLPKPIRRVLTPAPQFAEQAMDRLGSERSGALLDVLADTLGGMAGVSISSREFDEELLPDHLRLRFVIHDASGEVLAVSRDLAALQERFGARARRRFMDRQGTDWNRDGVAQWDFNELPATVQTGRGIKAWPALVDQESAVGLRLFDDADEAANAHFHGVLRLLAIECRDKLRYLEKHHGLTREAQMAWAPFGSVAALVSDLAWSAMVEAAGNRVLDIRTEAAFIELTKDVRKRLVSVFQTRAGLLDQVMKRVHAVSSLLDDRFAAARPGIFEDIDAQLQDLLYEGFLRDLEPDRFQHYPRYLEAVQLRLDRVGLNPARDLQLMSELQPWWQRYLDFVAAGGVYDERVDTYRWLLEEYRVSLFAQQLGTAEKVSAKRLEQAWQSATAGS